MAPRPRYVFQSDGGDHAEHDNLETLKAGADIIAAEGRWQEITDQISGGESFE